MPCHASQLPCNVPTTAAGESEAGERAASTVKVLVHANDVRAGRITGTPIMRTCRALFHLVEM